MESLTATLGSNVRREFLDSQNELIRGFIGEWPAGDLAFGFSAVKLHLD